MAATNDAELFELIENSADLTADLPQIIYRALMIKRTLLSRIRARRDCERCSTSATRSATRSRASMQASSCTASALRSA